MFVGNKDDSPSGRAVIVTSMLSGLRGLGAAAGQWSYVVIITFEFRLVILKFFGTFVGMLNGPESC